MKDGPQNAPSRRTFLRRAAGTVGLALVPGSLAGLVSACTGPRAATAPTSGARALPAAAAGEGGYGPVIEDGGPLAVPDGFRYRAMGAIGDPMTGGRPTPVAHDGMAAFRHPSEDDLIRLVRNHEVRTGPSVALGGKPYDPLGPGGCVTLEVDAARRLVRDFVSLSGTAVNCAGGPTPWGTWLSCEETVDGTQEGFSKPHGYVFEVPSAEDGEAEPLPIKAMGRFSHEAVAVDPDTGMVYLTEDNGYTEGMIARPGSGLYRYVPDDRSGAYGSLQKGGRLQMLAIDGEPRIQLFRGGSIGDTYDVRWVDIPHPDGSAESDAREARMTAVFYQGWNAGAAAFSRLEGCWYGEGSIFFNDTSGGAVLRGQVWQYHPESNKLILVFESPGLEVLDAPDNLCVSPRGGLVLCEDGQQVQHVRGLTTDGKIFDIARNTLLLPDGGLSTSEFAGACFSPDGETLFVNIQGATAGTTEEKKGLGMTLAIWGPWSTGAV